jgi:hypothetical protein
MKDYIKLFQQLGHMGPSLTAEDRIIVVLPRAGILMDNGKHRQCGDVEECYRVIFFFERTCHVGLKQNPSPGKHNKPLPSLNTLSAYFFFLFSSLVFPQSRFISTCARISYQLYSLSFYDICDLSTSALYFMA